jgi:CheY-like chemotaxis protein
MLAVNLLNRTQDALAVLLSAVTTDSDAEEIFAYCADGSCGFSFGVVDFFAHPIDPDACITRLLERRGTVQRLLAVSENVEMTGALREVLSRMRCSTSVAFDVRQAIDLLPMIKPEVVLVDFALPRGEGLRLVGRLRSDPKTRDVPLAVLLPNGANAAEFRQHALRAARESPLSPDQLGETLGEWLGAPRAGSEARAGGMLQTG